MANAILDKDYVPTIEFPIIPPLPAVYELELYGQEVFYKHYNPYKQAHEVKRRMEWEEMKRKHNVEEMRMKKKHKEEEKEVAQIQKTWSDAKAKRDEMKTRKKEAERINKQRAKPIKSKRQPFVPLENKDGQAVSSNMPAPRDEDLTKENERMIDDNQRRLHIDNGLKYLDQLRRDQKVRDATTFGDPDRYASYACKRTLDELGFESSDDEDANENKRPRPTIKIKDQAKVDFSIADFETPVKPPAQIEQLGLDLSHLHGAINIAINSDDLPILDDQFLNSLP